LRSAADAEKKAAAKRAMMRATVPVRHRGDDDADDRGDADRD
jgi:hypothetical protein